MTTPATSNRRVLFAEITFELTAPTAIGAPERQEGNVARLRPVARDGWDEPWIPPSSLAGSFRDHLPADLAPVLMGDAPEAEDGRPSPVRFLGTDLRLPDGFDGQLPRRTRTAIDPRRGAAATSLLRSSEYLPPGTRIRCWLRVDGARYHQPVEEALRTWCPVIGGGRTTGHGTVKAVAARRATLDLDTPEGRRIWLTSGGPQLLDRATSVPLSLVEPDRLEPLLPPTRWQIVDPLRVGIGPAAPGEIAEILRDHEGQPYVPGTAWKGLLRARAGYVLRSLDLPGCLGLSGPGTPPPESTQPPPRASGCCGLCELCTAFGWGGADGNGARGLLRVPDTPLVDAPVRVRQHVAIDRITGGATEGLLYAEEVVERGECVLTVETYGPVPARVRAALSLALWDLHCGLIGVGGGVTRGHGTLRCLDADRLESLLTPARRVLAAARSASERSPSLESEAHV